MTFSLLADIGGTNTRVALAKGTQVLEDSLRRYSNAEYKARGQHIAHILRDFLAEADVTVTGVCVAAAGPVQDGLATMTNLDWKIDAALLSDATGARRIRILNDLQAQGHALGHIRPELLRPVITGPQVQGSMLVVGLGTGVNAAPVHGTGAARVVPASECGHVNMPVRSEEDLRLMRYLENLLTARHETPHAGVEEVLAGRGLGNLYGFAAHEAGLDQHLDSAGVMAALQAGDSLAAKAGALYTRILAQTLADLSLVHLPWGGIYLIGGMGRAMAPWFERFGLTQSFREARRIDLLTHSFSVTVVEDDFAALTGCAAWLEASH